MRRLTWTILPALLLLACGNPARTDSSDDGGTGSGASPSSRASSGTGDGTGGTESTGSGASSVGLTGSGAGGSTGGTAGDGGSPTGGAGPIVHTDPELEKALAAVADWDAATFKQKTSLEFGTLSYDPLDAIGLDVIQSSSLGLSEPELGRLQQDGFVISNANNFPHFSYGYSAIYLADLPVYVSADSILHAMHSSYDEMLKSLEEYVLLDSLENFLDILRTGLQASALSEEVQTDLDLFLTVAASLALGEMQTPWISANGAQVESVFAKAVAAAGQESVSLFGGSRDLDFSQFKPRGHYTDSADLQKYFRAMIWLGRIDFRLMEADQQGQLQLNRRQVEATVGLVSLMNAEATSSFDTINDIVTAFVGEADYMTPLQAADFIADLGLRAPADLSDESDAELSETILSGNYGLQRISSHIMMGGLGGSTPLPPSFALLGQRYVIDSHVFSNVVWDRVTTSPKRMLPNPLDVAYAAFGNDHAGMLLEQELQTYDYASDLQSMRVLVDAEPEEMWDVNLYNRWLGAIRSLSPAQAWALGDGENLPEVAKTEAWGRRLLNTQLASWAELRHDTLLYVKQSYTSGASCEYPDAYVDPYPELYQKVVGFAEQMSAILAEHGITTDDIDIEDPYDFSSPNFLLYRTVADIERVLGSFVEVGMVLAAMAEQQRTGAPHSQAHIDFINEMVTVQRSCDGTPLGVTGWYGRLFMGAKAAEFAPVIADVHTQPTTETGGDLGRILHVGTGNTRLMVTTIDSCSGPRAYAGVVSSFYEVVRDGWVRLTDEEWEDILVAGEEPAEPEWIGSLTVE